MTFRSSDRCEDALDLAAAGFSVFPCRERGKVPLTATGFKAAVRDERQILTWWDRWPAANIGVACEASGITVLDIDTKAGADPAEILPELNGPLIGSWTGRAPAASEEYPDSIEGAEGAHVWYRGVTRTGRTQWPGVEVRSRGAYVIAPDSVHPSGVAYRWMDGRVIPVDGLPAVPPELQAGGVARNGHGTGDDWGMPADPDVALNVAHRHDGLLHVVGSLLARRVYEPDLLTGALLEANRVRCRPPKGEQEVRALARWAATSDVAAAGRVEQELARRLFAAWKAENDERSSP